MAYDENPLKGKVTEIPAFDSKSKDQRIAFTLMECYQEGFAVLQTEWETFHRAAGKEWTEFREKMARQEDEFWKSHIDAFYKPFRDCWPRDVRYQMNDLYLKEHRVVLPQLNQIFDAGRWLSFLNGYADLAALKIELIRVPAIHDCSNKEYPRETYISITYDMYGQEVCFDIRDSCVRLLIAKRKTRAVTVDITFAVEREKPTKRQFLIGTHMNKSMTVLQRWIKTQQAEGLFLMNGSPISNSNARS